MKLPQPLSLSSSSFFLLSVWVCPYRPTHPLPFPLSLLLSLFTTHLIIFHHFFLLSLTNFISNLLFFSSFSSGCHDNMCSHLRHLFMHLIFLLLLSVWVSLLLLLLHPPISLSLSLSLILFPNFKPVHQLSMNCSISK